MIAIDKGDEVLGILYAHPERISRDLLKKHNLSSKSFPLDKAQTSLFKLIVTASYANKKVDEPFLKAFAIRSKLSEEEQDNLLFALDRVKEQDPDFDSLEDKLTIYKKELKTALMHKLILETNDAISKGKDIDEIIEQHREEFQRVSTDQQDAEITSMRGRSAEFITEYEKPDATEKLVFGFKPLDDITGGVFPGEVSLMAGASNEGKSILLMNVIYNNLMAGKNMIWASLEMPRKQCLYRLLSLHSTIEKFGYNLEHKKIKEKTLSPKEKEQFYDVVNDLFDNPEYGQLFFTDSATTVSEIFDEAESINRFIKIDGVAIDYISLLRGKGSSEQAVIANNFKAIKSNALTFNKGQKVAVISVHQISEQAKEKAEEDGKYAYNFLADTSESKKSSDHIIWMLRTEAARQVHEALIGLNKIRDAEGVGETFSLFEDFTHMKLSVIDTEI